MPIWLLHMNKSLAQFSHKGVLKFISVLHEKCKPPHKPHIFTPCQHFNKNQGKQSLIQEISIASAARLAKLTKKQEHKEMTLSSPLTFLGCLYQQLADTYKAVLSGYMNSLSSKGEEKSISSGRSSNDAIFIIIDEVNIRL